ncbi:hypothetical protein ZWY2020_046251 [Hordeum vulgare]|nr:hypothetical protein ZWY2020_046251 [Hordeum vulgare]
MNIARRGVVLDTSCVVCHRLFEDDGHLFFRCKGVKPLWRGLQIEDIRMQLMECQGPIHVLECILKLPYEKKMMTVALLWAWWSERNKTNHNESRLSTGEFIFLIKRSTDEWLRFFKPSTKSSTTSTPRWTCPPAEIIKINTDGAFLEETRDGGWGALARDSNGSIIFAADGRITHAYDALHAETIAIQHAIGLANQLGMGRIILETDSQILKQALLSPSLDQSRLGHLFLDIKYQLITEFIDYAVEFCPRACNKPAHSLAVLGMRN